MATSGTYTWDPTVATVFDAAFQRAGIAPESVQHQHIVSAKRNLNILQTELATNQADAPYRIDEETGTLVIGTSAVTLASGTIDVIDLVLRDAGGTNDISVQRTNRDDYLRIPDKTTTGRPTQWYIDHSTLNAPYIQLWPVPDAAYEITYDRLRWMQDITAMGETFDARKTWIPTIIAGLAMYIALDFNIERFELLERLYHQSFKATKIEASGRGTVIVSARGFGAQRRRRR